MQVVGFAGVQGVPLDRTVLQVNVHNRTMYKNVCKCGRPVRP